MAKRMRYNTTYQVTRKIKIHTSPLREITYTEVGKFVKETPSMLIFDTFRVMKSTVVGIRAVERIDIDI